MANSWESPLLVWPGAVPAIGPDQGVAWHYGDPVAEQRAWVAGAGVADLSHYGVVRVTGRDRLSWLHALTTQHLESLTPGVSTELLVLSPHGHIEYAAAVIDDGSATWLYLDSGYASGLASWLDSMRFTRRVVVEDVTADYALLAAPQAVAIPSSGLAWQDPWPHVAPGATRYGPAVEDHPGNLWDWVVTPVSRDHLARVVTTVVDAGAQLVGTWATEALRVAAWRPRLSDVDHRTIPHEMDWLRTAVHLTKGCYRGQETVARVHNVGRPPRRLVMLHLDGSGHTLPDRSDAVVIPGGRQVGQVVAAARHHEQGPIAVAMVKRSVSADAPLLVMHADGEIAAAQEQIVPVTGESSDRPPAPGPVARGLSPRRGLR